MAEWWLMLLGEIGGGRGEPANLLVRHFLAVVFWTILCVLTWRHRRTSRPAEGWIMPAFILALVHESALLAGHALDQLGAFDQMSRSLFLPSLANALSLLVQGIMAASLVHLLGGSRSLAERFLAGVLMAALLYALSAVLWVWWQTRAVTLIGASAQWNDVIAHGLGLTMLVLAMVLLRSRKAAPTAALLALAMLAVAEALMIWIALSTLTVQATLLPIRNNLQLWAIPLIGLVWAQVRFSGRDVYATRTHNTRRRMAIGGAIGGAVGGATKAGGSKPAEALATGLQATSVTPTRGTSG